MSAAKKSAPPRTAGRLFREPEPPTGLHRAYLDGASRGNPGPAAYAVIFYRPDGSEWNKLAKPIGIRTNNEAEYYALIAALDFALAHGIRRLAVRSDSELLVRQMQRRYKVKQPRLRLLFEQAQRLARQLEYFSIEHIPREQNSAADALANQALDRHEAPPPSASRKLQPAALAGAARGGSTVPRRISARWANGALHPVEPLDLAEGTEVEISIHPPRR
ncbi:MAG: reverse transcriptase-like protein [Acidobacteriia bacterium]|jgi:ribonuclease HI|nr:reverse transcriptase-like protein [Terriglobia bacterium]